MMSLRATKSRGNPFLNFIIILFLSTAPCQAAISFDGVNDYIQIKNLNLTSGSFCTWINTNAINDGNENRLFSQTSGVTTQGGALGIGISGTGTGTLSEWNGGTWQILTAANAITANNWTHACVTYLGSNSTVKAYINGIAQVPSPNSNFDFNGVDIALGGNFLLTHGNKWLGSLDDTRIYNRTLTSTEIQTLYNSRSKRPSGSLANGLIAHYEMDDDGIGEVAAQAKDSSSNLNHGQFIGFDNLVSNGFSNDVPVQIGTGYSLEFDGINSYIQIAGPNSGPVNDIGTSDFTVSAWATNKATSNYQEIIGNWNTNGLFLGRDSATGQLHAYVGDANAHVADINYTIPSDNSWHFYTLKRNSGTCEIFVDGILRGSNFSAPGTLATSVATHIGSRGNSVAEIWDGNLDDIRIYNRALTSSEISFLYNGSGLDPGTSNLQALWTFDEDSALKDSSGNNNHGVGVGGDSLKYAEGILRR